jgi:hypothetical protein
MLTGYPGPIALTGRSTQERADIAQAPDNLAALACSLAVVSSCCAISWGTVS